MQEVVILQSYFDQRFTNEHYYNLLDHLPPFLKEKNLKYKRWQDRQSNLIGILLLIKGLKLFGYNEKVIYQIKYNYYGRPYISQLIDFNISHSGNYVLCAIGEKNRIGVDVELVRKVEFDNFKDVMSQIEWSIILNSSDPTHSFFKFWSIKESILKGDGCGLSIPLTQIDIQKRYAVLKGNIWYYQELKIGIDYISYISTISEEVKYRMVEMQF